ncbi:U6 snRNA-associated Sm-like protein LSm6 [Stomoxys calcitrans]|uniref:U6 snRNA-associated Sm-like protein LSm6 n=1 Tax=Stomoxys calcitrans TaxID=35570 RepID=UPI0027E315EC|nr:U6 snRNA-associated Sm-like protein LSm6 [Stomoxys calcitrans]
MAITLTAVWIFFCEWQPCSINLRKSTNLPEIYIIIIVKMSRKEALSQFINQIHGRPVVVKLNSGVDYRGVLACLDGYMNIALDQTEEYVNGQLKNKYGDAFIRGNNVLYISTQKRRV